jgi:hypothetical protein
MRPKCAREPPERTCDILGVGALASLPALHDVSGTPAGTPSWPRQFARHRGCRLTYADGATQGRSVGAAAPDQRFRAQRRSLPSPQRPASVFSRIGIAARAQSGYPILMTANATMDPETDFPTRTEN